MRRILGIFAAAVLLYGCSVDSDPYYNEVVDDPGYEIFSLSYDWKIGSLFRCAEMVDFFMAYEKIKNDRAASEALADSYFGNTWTSLYYEKLTLAPFGELDAEGDSTFVFYPYGMPYGDGERARMDVTVRQDGSISIICESEFYAMGAEMRVEDSVVSMDSYRSGEIEPGTGYSVHAFKDDASAPVSLPRCASDGFTYVPDTGEIVMEIDGKEVSDSFRIVFDKGRTGICRDGGQVMYYPSPSPAYGYDVKYR